MKKFKDKVVVVTGAGSGMGRAYALEFARLGARLALNDYDAAGLQETISLVRQKSETPLFSRAFDVSDKEAMDRFAIESKAELGHAHIVMNNAGVEGGNAPVYHLEESSYRRIMDINFFGVVNGTKAFLPQLVENNEGAIVNVASIFGLIGTPNSSDYCAAKFAVTGFTQSLAVEFEGSPISIHCVHPGGIATNISRSPETQEFVKKYLTTAPEKIVRHVIQQIRRGTPKIVYGNKAWTAWLGANFVPTRLLNGVLWHEVKRVIDKDQYRAFIKGGNL